MSKTHWKRLVNPDYIGAYSLEDGKDLDITIVSVKKEEVKGTGGKSEECTVAQLKNNKPFIVNRTNAKTITKVVGSPYIEDWAGKSVTVFQSTTKVAGEVVECLRVRPVAPKTKTPPNDLSKFEAMVNGCKTLEELKAAYESKGFPQKELYNLIQTKKNELSKN